MEPEASKKKSPFGEERFFQYLQMPLLQKIRFYGFNFPKPLLGRSPILREPTCEANEGGKYDYQEEKNSLHVPSFVRDP
jgi:hypothetical protein